jgi:hypothetical protein
MRCYGAIHIPDGLSEEKIPTSPNLTVRRTHVYPTMSPGNVRRQLAVTNVHTQGKSFRDLCEAIREDTISSFIIEIPVLMTLDAQLRHRCGPVTSVYNIQIPSCQAKVECGEWLITGKVCNNFKHGCICGIVFETPFRLCLDAGG